MIEDSEKLRYLIAGDYVENIPDEIRDRYIKLRMAREFGHFPHEIDEMYLDDYWFTQIVWNEEYESKGVKSGINKAWEL